MIPEEWNNLLEQPTESQALYDRLFSGFNWESSDEQSKASHRLAYILKTAFSKHGKMSLQVFENEVRGQLGPVQRVESRAANWTMSPEQKLQSWAEECDSEYFELLSYFPSRFWAQPREAKISYEPLPQKPPVAVPFTEIKAAAKSTGPIERVISTIQRQLRDTQLVTRLKELYGYRCQFCGTSIPTGRVKGWYCEAHHIRPLGSPHNGLDLADNIVIVCPNHHKMLDYGAMIIDLSEFALNRHEIARENIRYYHEELQSKPQ